MNSFRGWQRVEEDIATFAVSISLVESLSVRKEDDKVFNNLLKKREGDEMKNMI